VQTIEVETPGKVAAIDVTESVRALRLPDGWIMASLPHTTAALVLSEADEELLADWEALGAGLLLPLEPFRHHKNDNPNANAHLLSSLVGNRLTLPVVGGQLELGHYQRIVLLELDGPRRRAIEVRTLRAEPASR
jgi:secondary thiamine-phosphate synthase enzyme